MEYLKNTDPTVFNILNDENQRQENCLELIASENFVSQSVLEAYSNTLTNKYAEGYPHKRYYHGCENADAVEELAIDRLKTIFKAKFANVQSHSGAQANEAAFMAYMQVGDTFLGMNLNHGGHLSHGSKVNVSGKNYNAIPYGVRKEDHRIDFDQINALCKEHRPKLIIAGYSAYPRIIDFDRFQEICEKYNAVLLVDMAHIAGLIAGGVHPSPIEKAQVITSTTHKTLRGPRGGIILSNTAEDSKKINSAVFPGLQGGPLMHVIAAKAVGFAEALKPTFRQYAEKIVGNAKALAEALLAQDIDLVSNGTDNHLILIDLTKKNLTGKVVATELDKVGITTNKNTVPFDSQSPFVTSGIRMGTAALTTRGLGVDEMKKIGTSIAELIKNIDSQQTKEKISGIVKEICKSFPMKQYRLP